MSGTFVAVVGPSGAGKDTLIDLARAAVRGDGRFSFVRRVVTRAEGSPGEDHEALDVAAFAAARAAGRFALTWDAHGLSYAIPAEAGAAVGRGGVAVANLSRGAIDAAARHFGRVAVVHVTAPLEVRAARIAARGRESAEALAARLGRDVTVVRPDLLRLEIVNTGTPAEGAAPLIALLRQLAEEGAEVGAAAEA